MPVPEGMAGLVIDHVPPVGLQLASVTVGTVLPPPSVDDDVAAVATRKAPTSVQGRTQGVSGRGAGNNDAQVGFAIDARKGMLGRPTAVVGQRRLDE